MIKPFAIGCWFLLLLPSIRADCYILDGCLDPDTNETRTVKKWMDSCYDCDCYSSEKILLDSCFHVDWLLEPDAIPLANATNSTGANSTNELELSHEISVKTIDEWENIPEVIVDEADVPGFQCPELPDPTFDFESGTVFFPILKQVNYVTFRYTTECCAAFGIPILETDECELKWIEEECRYDVVYKETGEDCSVRDRYTFVLGK